MGNPLMSKTLTVYLAADLKKFNDGMDDADRRARGLGGTMSGMLGPALIGAAAAAGAFALKIGVEGVKAAMEDEAAAAKLAQTLENVGQAHNTDAVEEYIGSLEKSLGIADDQLRPAYDRLIRSLGDTQAANEALALSTDIAAGTGKSLQTVTDALAKAYDGNTGALGRLGAGIDSATLKSGDMQAITAKLSETFSGQATTAANTYQGQLNRLTIGVDNLKEAFGYGLLGALQDTESQTNSLMDTMEELEPLIQNIGKYVGDTANDYLTLATAVIGAVEAGNDFKDTFGPLEFVVEAVGSTLTQFLNPVSYTVDALNLGTEASDAMGISLDALDTTIDAVGGGAFSLAGTLTDLTPVLEDNAKTALQSAGSYQSLYEKIAAADRAARDFAGTSGTVSSAIAAGTRNTPGAQAAAAAAATRSGLTDNSVAQALAGALARSDARTGRPSISLPPFLVPR